MIEVQNLHKSFTTINAVNDVSFRVEPERVFGLLGPNGAGKTTIIRMIINIIRPDSGEIYFAGKPFNPQRGLKIFVTTWPNSEIRLTT